MLALNNHPVEINHFPDNSLHLTIDDYYRNSENTITWRYKNDEELFAVICLTKMIKEKMEKYGTTDRLILKMPYIPHARMDRVEDKKTAFTLKYFCDVINWLHFDTVYVDDPHSNVSVALLDRCIPWYPDTKVIHEIADYIVGMNTPIFYFPDNKFILFYPDEGAMKRYRNHITSLYPYTFGIKHRDWQTGKITSYEVVEPAEVKDKYVIIVDDICSKGNTFAHAATALTSAGPAGIYLYVTHLEPTVTKGTLLTNSLIKHIFTRQTIDPSGFGLENMDKITYV